MSPIAIRFDLNDHLYLKDPLSSDLGMKVISSSIDLIDEMGYEAFNFRKLVKEIGSTEASNYGYFENKHKILLYLWYWIENRLAFRLANIESALKRLDIAITVLTEPINEDGAFAHIDEVKLNRIIIGESSKSYLTKDVNEENKHGLFLAYKRLVQQVGENSYSLTSATSIHTCCSPPSSKGHIFRASLPTTFPASPISSKEKML